MKRAVYPRFEYTSFDWFVFYVDKKSVSLSVHVFLDKSKYKKKGISNLRMLNVMSNNPNSEFADYLWMGDEMDNFDQQMEAEFEEEIKEEEFIKSCIEQLLDEEEEQTVYFNPSRSSGDDPNVPNKLLYDPQMMFYQNTNQQVPCINGMNIDPSVTQQMQSMYIQQTQQQNDYQYHQIPPMTNGHQTEKPVENILSKVSWYLKIECFLAIFPCLLYIILLINRLL